MTENPPRLTIAVLGHYPIGGSDYGGVATHVRYLTEALLEGERHIQLNVFTFSQRSIKHHPIQPQVISVPSRWIYRALPPLALVRLMLSLRKTRPDVVHVQGSNLSPYLLVGLWLTRSRIAKVLTWHGNQALEWVDRGKLRRNSLLHRTLEFLQNASARRATRIIAVTESTAKYLNEVYHISRDRISVIPNGVDLKLFTSRAEGSGIRKRFGIPDETFLLLFAKRFSRLNGPANAILCVEHLRRRGRDIKLVMLGDGELREELDGLVRRLHIDDRVVFPGVVEHHVVSEFLAASDAVLIPSMLGADREEGFPLLMLEAMAAGAPLIATKTGGLREMLEGSRSGILVEEPSPETLAAAVERLMDDKQLGENLTRRAQEVASSYSWDGIADETVKAYRVASKEHGG